MATGTITTTIGLKKYTIRDLDPNAPNCMVVGIIISKTQPRKLSGQSLTGENRAVWNLTLRDSPRDYINATYWGSVDTIFAMNEKFQIGDIVEIQKPRIEVRKLGDSREQYSPIVTSPFKLILTDNESNIISLRDGPYQSFLRILHLPTKPINNYVALANIQANVANFAGQLIDILVAVRAVHEVRNVKTRNGEAQVRNVSVFDYTSASLNISIWDTEYIARSSLWKPRVTILFMTDMKVFYDSFSRGAKASFSMRTIITEDPFSSEADNLRNYAKTAPLDSSAILDHLACAIPDPSSIQTVMNVAQILQKIKVLKASTTSNRPEDKMFTCIVYAVLTDFDLDGLSKVVTTRCIRCRQLVSETKCENAQCTIGMGAEAGELETNFDMIVTVADQTGSLHKCRLTGKHAQKILNCTPQEFMAMSDDEKCNLKWKYLLERCDIRLMVLCAQNPMITVIGCANVDPSTIINIL